MPTRHRIQHTTRPRNRTQKAPFYAIYLSTFLFAYHIALPLYVNSSFLSSFVSEAFIGYIYAAAALLGIIGLARYPHILRTFGNYRTVLILMSLEAMLLTGLAFLESPFILIPLFVIWQALITLGLFNLDVFLESFSDDRITGTLRGAMLTILNLAILLGPVSASIILTDSQFERIYLFSALLLIPMWILIARQFRSFKDPKYRRQPLLGSIRSIVQNESLRYVFISNFLLRFFYSWMVLYTPIYLNKVIGFPWSEIGVILTIMLIPFVLLEIPTGKIADKYLGEKEIMMAGFLVIAAFVASLSFITAPSFFIWTALLFGTRVGASFVEITTESYFFKQVGGRDTGIISVFRDTLPLAYLIGPFSASLLLLFVPLQYLFFILAFIMLFGIYNSFQMQDTK